MEVKLIVLGGKREGREIPVPGPEFLIGRADGCHLRAGSDRVSRRHALIRIKAGSVTVEDCGSKNGTLVNDKQTEGEQRLKTGDRLTIGPLEFEVQLAVNVGGKKKPKVKNVQEAVSRTVEASVDDDMDISAWLEGDDGTDSSFNPKIVFRTKGKDDEDKVKKKSRADDLESAKLDTQDSREAATKMLRKFFDPNQ
jgi:pSer/pThr/pTyr-binding forkhead associated (FHA) protein